MSTALAAWRRHRVDYRWPALAALVLASLILALLPRTWRFLDQRPIGTLVPERSLAPFFAEDEGLQLIDVRLLQGGAGKAASKSAPTVVRSESSKSTPRDESEELGTGENDYAFDPTHAYRLGQELLKPDAAPHPLAQKSIPLAFGSIVDSRGHSALAPRDSQVTRAELNFAQLQRQLFLKNAPTWAMDKATERARELYLKMFMSNPLRGPQ